MKCPHCSSMDTELVVTGSVQCYFCNTCGRTFMTGPSKKA